MDGSSTPAKVRVKLELRQCITSIYLLSEYVKATQGIALDLFVSEKMRVQRVFSVAEVSLWGTESSG